MHLDIAATWKTISMKATLGIASTRSTEGLRIPLSAIQSPMSFWSMLEPMIANRTISVWSARRIVCEIWQSCVGSTLKTRQSFSRRSSHRTMMTKNLELTSVLLIWISESESVSQQDNTRIANEVTSAANSMQLSKSWGMAVARLCSQTWTTVCWKSIVRDISSAFLWLFLGYILKSDMSGDGIHPTNAGYKKMADVWAKAIASARKQHMLQEPENIENNWIWFLVLLFFAIFRRAACLRSIMHDCYSGRLLHFFHLVDRGWWWRNGAQSGLRDLGKIARSHWMLRAMRSFSLRNVIVITSRCPCPYSLVLSAFRSRGSSVEVFVLAPPDVALW